MSRRGIRERRFVTAGGGSFSFADYYSLGCKLHLDAALGVTDAGGGRVSQWNDQSGNGNNLAQATGAAQPLLVSGATSASTPAVHTDSTARFMIKAAAPQMAAARCTLFLVVKTTTNNSGFGHLRNDISAGFWQNTSAGNRGLEFRGSTTTTDSAYNTTRFEVLCWRLEATGGFGTALTTRELYVNQVSQTMATTPNYTQANTAGNPIFIIGRSGASSLTQYAELAYFPDVLIDAGTCAVIMAGLQRKHGVS